MVLSPAADLLGAASIAPVGAACDRKTRLPKRAASEIDLERNFWIETAAFRLEVSHQLGELLFREIDGDFLFCSHLLDHLRRQLARELFSSRRGFGSSFRWSGCLAFLLCHGLPPGYEMCRATEAQLSRHKRNGCVRWFLAR